jgi:uncharacterized protein YecT (DUF1311 family)
MRAFPSTLVLALFCAANNTGAQEMMAEALKDCDKNQLTINFCARHAFDTVDAELNKIYKTLLATMSTPNATERLRQAQRAWVVFRDKDCLVLVGSPENGGSMYQGLWWRCLERRTKERVVELEKLDELLKCEEQPCPPKE